MAGPSRHRRRFDNWKSTRIVVRPRVVGDEVGVALGFFVVELRQELRRAVALRPPCARKQRTSKYVRWSGVFIYRTVENVRRRSHRHRNSAIRPHGNGDFMLRPGAFLHSMRRNGDPLFQFSLLPFVPLLVVVIRVSSFSLSSTLFPPLRPLSLSVRRITGGRGKTSRTGGGIESRLSPGRLARTSRGKKRVVHHGLLDYPTGGMRARAPASGSSRRQERVLRPGEMPIFFDRRFQFPFHPSTMRGN